MATGYDDLENLTQQQNSLLQQQEQKQNEIIDQQIQMQQDELNREKEKLDKETQKTTSGLYTDYQKQVNQYGAGMEQLQEQGLANSGYAETTRTALYNNYQKSVTDTLNKSNELKADYDFKIQQAIQTGSVQKAQSALELYAQKLQLLTQNYQLKYQQQRDQIADQQWQKQFDYQQQRNEISDKQWQQQFDYQVKQNELENQWKQKEFEYQQQRDKIADSQWQQQFNLSKKKSVSSSKSSSSKSSSSKSSSSKNSYNVSSTTNSTNTINNTTNLSPEEILKNMTIVAGPGLKNNVKDKLSGKTFSSPEELLNYYGYINVE